jgi:hypothetical protein
VTHSRREIKRLHYLALPGLPVRRAQRQGGDGGKIDQESA